MARLEGSAMTTITTKMARQFVEEYAGGSSIEDISARHGPCYWDVHKTLTGQRVQIRVRGNQVRPNEVERFASRYCGRGVDPADLGRDRLELRHDPPASASGWCDVAATRWTTSQGHEQTGRRGGSMSKGNPTGADASRNAARLSSKAAV
jgi:hypothetical protein